MYEDTSRKTGIRKSEVSNGFDESSLGKRVGETTSTKCVDIISKGTVSEVRKDVRGSEDLLKNFKRM